MARRERALALLIPAEAGASKAEELDGELLACCAPDGARMTRAARLPARTPEGLRANAFLDRQELAGSGLTLPVVASLLQDVLGRAP